MMLRRTVLQWLATAAGTLRFTCVRAWAQTIDFPGNHRATLRELARIVLPSELGREGCDRVTDRFEQWVRAYHPGAEMEHGYGFTRIRFKASSPAPAYIAQLERLRLSLTNAAPQNVLEAALDQAGVRELPRAPDGRHIASDLMSFYFHSSDGNDLCYRAAIGRDRCRGLDGSGNPPPPLNGGPA
jgi:hypothetical protein